jgi:hypothetical protein
MYIHSMTQTLSFNIAPKFIYRLNGLYVDLKNYYIDIINALYKTKRP